MRRPLAVLGAVIAAGGGAAVTAVGDPEPARGAPPAASHPAHRHPAPARAAVRVTPANARNPSRLLVTADDFRLALSRGDVRRGVAVVQLLNAGEDVHDLRLQRLDGRGRPRGAVLRVPRVAPGGLGEVQARLAPGRWRLTCTVAGHERMGMVATLRVR